MRLRPFQQRFIKGAFAPGIDTAALSLPRGNGKSWLAGLLVARALHPGDPMYKAGAEVVLLAGSLEQARIVFNFTREFLEATSEDYSWLDSSTRIGIKHKAMANDRRCSVCCRFLTNARRARWPGSTTCGEGGCEIENRRRVSATPEYTPPADGSPDSADPLFKPRARDCGRCGSGFVTCPKWRYFCGRCRKTNDVRFPPADCTYAISNERRSSSG